MIGDNDPSHKIIFNNNEIVSSNKEKLSGILFDNKLSFDSHITSLYRKAGQKRSALIRTSYCLSSDQKILSLNLVVKCQFSYCPLIWMLASRDFSKALKRIHKPALGLIYNDHEITWFTMITRPLLIEYYRKTSKKSYIKKYWVFSCWNL